MDGIGVFGDVEVLLDDAPRVGEKRPVGADAAAVFVGLGEVVGADRDEPRVGDLHLAMELRRALRPAGDPWGKIHRGSAREPSDSVPATRTACDVFRCGRRAHSRETPLPEPCQSRMRHPPRLEASRRRCRDARRPLFAQACFNKAGSTGIFRRRLPVAAKIALATAGTMSDVPASPMPPGGSKLWTMWTSTAGASSIRSIS